MNNQARINRIKVVDDSIDAMQRAGYDLSQADMAFIWRSALGEACEDEITAWTKKKALTLGNAAFDRTRLGEMQSAAELIGCSMKLFGKRLRILARNN